MYAQRSTWFAVAFAAFVVVLALLFATNSTPGADASGGEETTTTSTVVATANNPVVAVDDYPSLDVATLEDPGPGRCAPDLLAGRRGQLADGTLDNVEGINNFTPPYTAMEKSILRNDMLEWANIAWETEPCLRDDAEFADMNPEWFMADSVMLKAWNRDNPDNARSSWDFDPSSKDEYVTYLSELILDDIDREVVVENHAWRTASGSWESLGNQRFPAGELLYFVPGYEPGNKEGNPWHPVNKLVCLNPLLPPDNGPPPGTTTTTTTRPTVTTTTRPSTTTTTEPSTTTTTLAPKDPPALPNRNPETPDPAKVTTPAVAGIPDNPATHDPTNPDVIDDGYCQTCDEPTTPPVVITTTTTMWTDESPTVTTPNLGSGGDGSPTCNPGESWVNGQDCVPADNSPGTGETSSGTVPPPP